MSVDGYIDDTSSGRLLLSNDADFDRVDAQRALADAVLVGANTIRHDNPRLLVRSPARRSARQERGLPASPAKVTITGSGNLDPQARFFTAGGAEVRKLVYCASPAVRAARERLSMVPATSVIDAGSPLDLVSVVTDLTARGVGRLMVEGGQKLHTQFLAAGLADELQLVIAPFFVGDPVAPRFVGGAAFPWNSGHRMTLAEARPIGDVVLLRYLLTAPSRLPQPDTTTDRVGHQHAGKQDHRREYRNQPGEGRDLQG
jgi:riboflavin-specific deaminase-like protein